jgi:hypothetical protein
MYVRWKRRWILCEILPLNFTIPRAYIEQHRHWSLDAVLVESRRVQGKVVQRHIAHLGSVKEISIARAGWEPSDEYDVNRQVTERQSFWRKVDRRLEGLRLDAATRAAVESALVSVVPRPPAAVVDW